jgi:aryl-alcohol dehydrogenase-like predicted oxidoreductase
MCQGRYWSDDAMFDVVGEVAAVAELEGRSPAGVAIAWLLSKPHVTAPVVGASRPQQLDDSLQAVGHALSADSLGRLDAVSERWT